MKRENTPTLSCKVTLEGLGDDERPDYEETEYEDDPDSAGEVSSFIHWPRDPQIEPAKADLKEWFRANSDRVFYGRQLEVIFEKKYFTG